MPVGVRGRRLHKMSFNVFYLCFARRVGEAYCRQSDGRWSEDLHWSLTAALAEWTCPSAASCLPQKRSLRVNGWTLQRAGVTSVVCGVCVCGNERTAQEILRTGCVWMPIYWFTFWRFKRLLFFRHVSINFQLQVNENQTNLLPNSGRWALWTCLNLRSLCLLSRGLSLCCDNGAVSGDSGQWRLHFSWSSKDTKDSAQLYCSWMVC